MLIREDQILGQVKQAYDFTCRMSLGGKELSLIFQETLNFVKKMKHKYQNGIRGFFNYLKMQRVDHRSLTTVRFACIGEKTANLLQ